jgi:hypothetical protein
MGVARVNGDRLAQRVTASAVEKLRVGSHGVKPERRSVAAQANFEGSRRWVRWRCCSSRPQAVGAAVDVSLVCIVIGLLRVWPGVSQ